MKEDLTFSQKLKEAGVADDLIVDNPVIYRSLNQKDMLYFDEHAKGDKGTYFGKYHVVHSSGRTGIPRYFVYDNAA